MLALTLMPLFCADIVYGGEKGAIGSVASTVLRFMTDIPEDKTHIVELKQELLIQNCDNYTVHEGITVNYISDSKYKNPHVAAFCKERARVFGTIVAKGISFSIFAKKQIYLGKDSNIRTKDLNLYSNLVSIENAHIVCTEHFNINKIDKEVAEKIAQQRDSNGFEVEISKSKVTISYKSMYINDDEALKAYANRSKKFSIEAKSLFVDGGIIKIDNPSIRVSNAIIGLDSINNKETCVSLRILEQPSSYEVDAEGNEKFLKVINTPISTIYSLTIKGQKCDLSSSKLNRLKSIDIGSDSSAITNLTYDGKVNKSSKLKILGKHIFVNKLFFHAQGNFNIGNNNSTVTIYNSDIYAQSLNILGKSIILASSILKFGETFNIGGKHTDSVDINEATQIITDAKSKTLNIFATNKLNAFFKASIPEGVINICCPGEIVLQKAQEREALQNFFHAVKNIMSSSPIKDDLYFFGVMGSSPKKILISSDILKTDEMYVSIQNALEQGAEVSLNGQKSIEFNNNIDTTKSELAHILILSSQETNVTKPIILNKSHGNLVFTKTKNSEASDVLKINVMSAISGNKLFLDNLNLSLSSVVSFKDVAILANVNICEGVKKAPSIESAGDTHVDSKATVKFDSLYTLARDGNKPASLNISDIDIDSFSKQENISLSNMLGARINDVTFHNNVHFKNISDLSINNACLKEYFSFGDCKHLTVKDIYFKDYKSVITPVESDAHTTKKANFTIENVKEVKFGYTSLVQDTFTFTACKSSDIKLLNPNDYALVFYDSEVNFHKEGTFTNLKDIHFIKSNVSFDKDLQCDNLGLHLSYLVHKNGTLTAETLRQCDESGYLKYSNDAKLNITTFDTNGFVLRALVKVVGDKAIFEVNSIEEFTDVLNMQTSVINNAISKSPKIKSALGVDDFNIKSMEILLTKDALDFSGYETHTLGLQTVEKILFEGQEMSRIENLNRSLFDFEKPVSLKLANLTFVNSNSNDSPLISKTQTLESIGIEKVLFINCKNKASSFLTSAKKFNIEDMVVRNAIFNSSFISNPTNLQNGIITNSVITASTLKTIDNTFCLFDGFQVFMKNSYVILGTLNLNKNINKFKASYNEDGDEILIKKDFNKSSSYNLLFAMSEDNHNKTNIWLNYDDSSIPVHYLEEAFLKKEDSKRIFFFHPKDESLEAKMDNNDISQDYRLSYFSFVTFVPSDTIFSADTKFELKEHKAYSKFAEEGNVLTALNTKSDFLIEFHPSFFTLMYGLPTKRKIDVVDGYKLVGNTYLANKKLTQDGKKVESLLTSDKKINIYSKDKNTKLCVKNKPGENKSYITNYLTIDILDKGELALCKKNTPAKFIIGDLVGFSKVTGLSNIHQIKCPFDNVTLNQGNVTVHNFCKGYENRLSITGEKIKLDDIHKNSSITINVNANNLIEFKVNKKNQIVSYHEKKPFMELANPANYILNIQKVKQDSLSVKLSCHKDSSSSIIFKSEPLNKVINFEATLGYNNFLYDTRNCGSVENSINILDFKKEFISIFTADAKDKLILSCVDGAGKKLITSIDNSEMINQDLIFDFVESTHINEDIYNKPLKQPQTTKKPIALLSKTEFQDLSNESTALVVYDPSISQQYHRGQQSIIAIPPPQIASAIQVDYGQARNIILTLPAVHRDEFVDGQALPPDDITQDVHSYSESFTSPDNAAEADHNDSGNVTSSANTTENNHSEIESGTALTSDETAIVVYENANNKPLSQKI